MGVRAEGKGHVLRQSYLIMGSHRLGKQPMDVAMRKTLTDTGGNES